MQSVTNGVSPLEGGGSLRGKAFGMSTTDFPRIDRDRLRTRARRLDRWALLALFDRAVEHVPDAAMEAFLNRLVKPNDVAETGVPLLEEVREFCRLSRKRNFYESFEVNWKNSNTISQGTEYWLAECERLFRKCATDESGETLQAFDLLFGLLREVDDGEEIVFFADEGGSYLLSPGWESVLPAYFACLARATEPGEYARRAMDAIGFAGQDEKFLRAARDAATSEQRLTLLASMD